MSESILIKADRLTKIYKIWSRPSSRITAPFIEAAANAFPLASKLRTTLDGIASRHSRNFHALRDVSFEIRRGEATGIIGRNGSGKSTLLQIIAGTLAATTGNVSVNGRVSALLELGSGFNPEFTGRENVYLNGAIHGFTRDDMSARMREVLEFADIGDFVDQPVKTYSSGMMMRLAFAVAVNVQPDVLIVDEALAVGDVFFSQKCFQRIRDIVHRGATLIFVSHDMAAVQSLCDRALLLNQGSLLFDGSPEECVSRYFNLHSPSSTQGSSVAGTHPAVDQMSKRALLDSNIVSSAKSRHGDRSFEIAAAAIVDGHGASSLDFEMMHRASIRVLFRANKAIGRPSVGLQLHDRTGNLVFAAGTTQLRFAFPAMAAGQEVLLEFRLALTVQPGAYTLSLDAAEFDEENPNIGHFYDRIGGLGPITVSCHGQVTQPFYGIAQLPLEISYL
jgi:lipopolysaccharide transport system ATP-binding protein